MLVLMTLLLQLAIPLAAGLFVSVYLRDAVYRLLVDLCGTGERADFWLRAIGVLAIGTPMVLVLLFGDSINLESRCVPADFADTIRHTLALSLGGVLLSVGLVSRVIWKQAVGGSKPSHVSEAGA